jgi:hypothetical protein
VSGSGQWLLDFTIGGRLYRYSTSRAEVVDASGRTLLYLSGLVPFELGAGGALDEQGFQVIDNAADWCGLAARGIRFEGGAATLRWWRTGDSFERAYTVIDGVLRDPELGDPEAMGSLVASVIAITGADVSFAPQSTVSRTTWIYEPTGDAIYDDSIEGATYPLVFGYPGYHETANPSEGSGPVSAGDALLIPAVPALLVRYDGTTGAGGSALLVAWGGTEASVNFLRTGKGTVRVYCPDIDGGTFFGFAYEVLDVQERADLLGQLVSFVEFGIDTIPDPHPIQPFLGFHYYTAWGPPEFDVDDHGGGGIVSARKTPGGAGPNTAGPKPIRALTDVALFILRNSGRTVDLLAQEAERDRLDSYAVDGFLNEDVQLLPWFEQNIRRLFPIVQRTGPRGIYYGFVNWWATAVEAIAVLVAGNNGVRRSSSLKTAGFASIRNRFTLDYARNAMNGAYTARMILGPEDGVLDPGLELDGRVVGDPRCAASVANYGLIDADAVQSSFVWSDQQAAKILQHWSQRDTEGHSFVSYTGPNFGDLRPGAVVTITDAEVGLDRAVALVNGVVLSGARLQALDLEVIARPFRATS